MIAPASELLCMLGLHQVACCTSRYKKLFAPCYEAQCSACIASGSVNSATPRTCPQLLSACTSRGCLPQEDEDDDEDEEDVKEKEKKKVLKPPGAAKRPRPAKPRSPKAQAAAGAAEDGEEGDDGEDGSTRKARGSKESPVPLYYEAPTLRRSTVSRVQDAERERQQQQVRAASGLVLLAF